jgi:creatinine amidohydrolase
MYMLYMNMDRFADAVKQVETAVIPIGMTEAHGHHCPLGTDVIIPRRFLELIEQQMGERLIIAPEIPYGHSWNLAPYPGTVDIPADVFGEYVFQVGKGLAKWGIKKLVLFNGHGGNAPALSSVMERLADMGLTVMLINWWLDYAAEIRTICEGQGHAGEDETSTVLAIDESLVDMSKAHVNWKKAIANIKYPGISLKTLAFAQTGDATKASKAKGEAIYALVTEKIIALLDRFLQDDLIEERH